MPVQTNFTGLTVVGPSNGSTLKVISQVTLADGSYFNFDYTSWGQVKKISSYAADNHLLNYRSYNLPPDSSTAQTDGPRFTERRDWAESWNGDTGGSPDPSEEVVTQFAVPAPVGSWTMPDGSTQSGGTVTQVRLPDGTYHKTYSHSLGWDKGLPLLTETYDMANVRQRQSTTTWTQDNTAVSYRLNPRATETNVYDPAGNRARSTVAYATFSLADGTTLKMPEDVYEYQANATTVLRRTHTDYNTDSAYSSRRILGLVSEKRLYEVDPNTLAETLMSKASFQYDETGSIQGNDAPVQHDNLNYGASFISGRANLSSVKRYDVINTSQFTTVSSKYNTAGAVVSTTDALSHTVAISYADAFAATGTTLDAARSFATFAYPTTVTDADDYTASTRYNYDFGAATWKQTPAPNTIYNTPGPSQKMAYDSVGRLEKVTNLFNNAYTRFEFPSSKTRVDTYVTLQENLGEAHSFKISDGHGRVIGAAADHPGSVGSFSGQRTEYDTMGRVKKTYNPTETSASGAPSQWTATGDDATAGWLYTQQTYDWKGRPLITTNPDGTTKEASYGGCGCAGGAVVTLTDEGTNAGGPKRQQKIYSDVLGRTVKTEVMNWNGVSVYSATVNSYNARNQITQVREYAGAAGSGTYQDTAMSYDGYGRLKTRHVPKQQIDPLNSVSTDHTTWDYNADDTVQKITDARGAISTFAYNNRHLVTSNTYTVLSGVPTTGPSAVTPAAAASFAYDAAGNRTSMTDGLGSMSYHYDTLSRMDSETRTITGVGSYPLSYTYNLSGALTSITNSFGNQVGYNYDSSGRVTAVTGSNFANISSFAANIKYRAWGALKQLDYGNTRTLSMSYNSRLQPASFTVPGVMSKTYDYYADGKLKFSHDLIDAKFDRSYSYDHAGRITDALSGAEARNEGTTNLRPYKETFVYDALGHLVERPINLVWSGQGGTFNPSHQTYQNERNIFWQYDAAGNLTDSGDVDYTIDAGGQTSRVNSLTYIPYNGNPYSTVVWITNDQSRSLDGDGALLKLVNAETTHDNEQGDETTTATTYLLCSSVLGGKVVTEIDSETGGRKFVYLGSEVLASQLGTGNVEWEHRDPHNASFRMTGSTGSIYSVQKAELDPLSTNAGTADPTTLPSLKKLSLYPGWGEAIMRGDSQCMWDDLELPCDMYGDAINSGQARIPPRDLNNPRLTRTSRQRGFNHGASTGDPFENAAEYGDSVDAWESPLWVPSRGVTDGGINVLGYFDQAPQDTKLDPQSVGGSPTNPFKSLGRFERKLNACTKPLFGVGLQSFTRSRDGHNGSFTGYGADAYSAGGRDTEITVVNEVNAYTGTQLAALHGMPAGNTLMGLTISPQAGSSSSYSPYRNFTASSLTNSRAILATQIHELGNSLRRITGVTMAPNSTAGLGNDTDPGTRLERCVFGGEIDQHGYLHHF